MSYKIEAAILNEFDYRIKSIRENFISKTSESFKSLRDDFIDCFDEFKCNGQQVLEDFIEISERRNEVYKNTQDGEIERQFIDREYRKVFEDLRGFFI